MRIAPLILLLPLLAACTELPRLNDARAQTLLTMPGPQHYAERTVARELAGNCPSYGYDEELAETMTRARLKMRLPVAAQVRGAADVETDVKRRALALRYGASRYTTLSPCAVLDAETAARTPMSVLVMKRG